MARLLSRESWFDELSAGSMYEVDFERLILSKADALFPDFHTVPFKSMILSDEDAAKPDFALVDKHYGDWWVVEVELGHHSLGKHVLPQVRTLSRGHYGQELAVDLCANCPYLEKPRIIDMLKGKQPNVLVIVNTQEKDWVVPVESYSAQVAFLGVFRSDKNEHILVADGTWPTGRPEYASECYLDNLLPRLLVVDSPSALGMALGERAKILFQNYATEWERIDGQDRVWLAPVGLNPLHPRVVYQLSKRRDGSRILVEVRER